MAYRLCVPVMLMQDDDIQREGLVSQLKAAKTDTVFLVFNRYLTDEDALAKAAEDFRENKAFFEEQGFSVGAWLAPTIGYGAVSSYDGDAPARYTRIVMDNGYVCPGAYCPLDDDFVKDFLRTLGAIVDAGAEEIMFEDDYTLGGGKAFQTSGCLCERHRKKLAEITGEDLPLPKIRERLYGGKTNDYRRAFLALQKETLIDFTKKIEAFVHQKNPAVRLGLSANASSYQIEGATFADLVNATRGDTRPFARMTGAPYWDQVPSLAANIEAIRIQCHFLKETGAELITEGDVYPRPRHFVPANLLEGYDMALRASGESHGILKYMTEYCSRPDYETGYFDRHIKNEPHYREIEKRFSGKECVGLNVAEFPSLFWERDLETDVSAQTQYGYGGYLPVVSQWFASDNSIPTVYGKTGSLPSLIFGENARHIALEDLGAGAVLDAAAARILSERGVDVGFSSYEVMPPLCVEYYTEYKDFTITQLPKGASFYHFKLKDGAKVLSEHPIIATGFGNYSEHLWHTAPRATGTYQYENEKGQRFLVFPFVAETAWGKGVWCKGAFKSYYRQKQLAEGVAWVAKKPLPAMCYGNPFLYIVAKKDEAGMSVGVWNFFADEVQKPVIELDEVYAKADIYLKKGRLEGRRLVLDEDIPPYGFALFTVYR